MNKIILRKGFALFVSALMIFGIYGPFSAFSFAEIEQGEPQAAVNSSEANDQDIQEQSDSNDSGTEEANDASEDGSTGADQDETIQDETVQDETEQVETEPAEQENTDATDAEANVNEPVILKSAPVLKLMKAAPQLRSTPESTGELGDVLVASKKYATIEDAVAANPGGAAITINKGVVELSTELNNTYYITSVKSGATLVIKDGGKLQTTGTRSAVSTSAGSTVIMDGGSITTEKGRGIYNNGGTITINNGTITSTGTGVCIENKSGGTLTVKGGEMTSAGACAIDNSGTITELSGGTLTGGKSGSVDNVRYSNAAVGNEKTGVIQRIGGSVVIKGNDDALVGLCNEGTIDKIEGGTIKGGTSYALYNKVNSGSPATIGDISDVTVSADGENSDAFFVHSGSVGTISSGTFTGGTGMIIAGGTVAGVTGGTFTGTGTGQGLYYKGGTLSKLSGGTFTASGTGNNANAIEISRSIDEISGVTATGTNSGLQLDSNVTVGTIKNVTAECTNKNAFYMGGNTKVTELSDCTFTGGDGIYIAGGGSTDKTSKIDTIKDVEITASKYGIHMGGTGSMYMEIGEITGDTKVTATGSNSGIFMVGSNAKIGTIDGMQLESNAQGISIQGGTIESIISAADGDVTIKGDGNAISNYSNGKVNEIAGYVTIESSSSRTAISNAQGSTIKLEVSGGYDLETDQPNVGYVKYKATNAETIIDPIDKFTLPEGYRMSKEPLDDGYYHLVKVFKVQFDSNNPDSDSPTPAAQDVGYGEKAAEPDASETPVKTGYDLAGWFDEALETAWNFAQDVVTGDMTLYAKWNAHTYKVIFDSNEGTGQMEDQSFTYDADPQALTANAFTREGYTFTGWDTEPAGGGTSFSDGQEVRNLTADKDGEVTLYAQWEANHYTVIFDSNGGTGEMENQSFVYDADPQALTANAFTKEGHTFTGWDTEPAGGGDAFSDEEEVKNLTSEKNGEVTLYAQWKVNEYVITYDPNGGNWDGSEDPVEVDAVYGETIQVYDAPERDGYKFLYWKGSKYQPGDDYVVSEDHTFTAMWEEVQEEQIVNPDDQDDSGQSAQDDSGQSAQDDSAGGTDTKVKDSSAKTGDSAGISLWIALLLMTAAAMAGAGLLVLRRRA